VPFGLVFPVAFFLGFLLYVLKLRGWVFPGSPPPTALPEFSIPWPAVFANPLLRFFSRGVPIHHPFLRFPGFPFVFSPACLVNRRFLLTQPGSGCSTKAFLLAMDPPRCVFPVDLFSCLPGLASRWECFYLVFCHEVLNLDGRWIWSSLFPPPCPPGLPYRSRSDSLASCVLRDNSSCTLIRNQAMIFCVAFCLWSYFLFFPILGTELFCQLFAIPTCAAFWMLPHHCG